MGTISIKRLCENIKRRAWLMFGFLMYSLALYGIVTTPLTSFIGWSIWFAGIGVGCMWIFMIHMEVIDYAK
jgi:hypothetical protein